MEHETEHTPDDTSTSVTLLHSLRVRADDEAAWARFVDRYQPLILKWCAGFGLLAPDAADVAQDVMVKLSVNIRDFEYDSQRSFRAWLKTVTHHAWHDWTRKEQRHQHPQENHEALQSLEARDELIQRLQREYDSEVLELAVLRVQLRVTRQVWQAFEMTAFEGISGIEAAKQLKMDVAKLYVHKSRVTKFLQEEIQRIEPDFPDEPLSD